jgi:hypothetical protein
MTSPSASNVSGVDGQVFHHTISEACLPTSPPVPSQPTTFGSHSAPPQFVKPLSDLTVTEGNKVTLDCRLSTSVLPDRIQWYCKGVELFFFARLFHCTLCWRHVLTNYRRGIP